MTSSNWNDARDMAGDTADDETQTRYETLNARLVDATGLHLLPKPEPLVAELLDLNSLCWIQGKPGHGKSLVALDIAGHVALGRSWHHRPVTHGNVLYLAAEGAHGLHARVAAWQAGNETVLPEGAITFLPTSVQLLNPTDLYAMLRIAREQHPALLVIDTQARCTVGADENSAKDMSQLVEAAEQIQIETGACVLLVHHEPRNGQNLRGHSSMEGAAATIIRVVKDGHSIMLTCGKQKEHADFDPINGQLVLAAGGAYYCHDVVSHWGPETTGNELLIVSNLRDLFETTGASVTALVDVTGLSRATVYRALKSLVCKGKVRSEGTGARSRYVLVNGNPE